MFGASQIRQSVRQVAWMLLLTFIFVPSLVHAESPAIKRFARSYRMAWSAPTPIPLLNLAVHPSVFTELAALDRWDFLDFSEVQVEILKHGRTSGSEITVEILRLQRDHFLQGTFTVGEVRERLVLSPWRGELRIKRYLGAISAVRRSSMPRTWSGARDAERLLMHALEALAIHDPEGCLDNIYGLFQKNGRSAKLAIQVPEPFKDRKTALSNAYFVRAACTRIALEDIESNASDEHINRVKKKGTIQQVLDDLDRALEADKGHHLARLLRARINLAELSGLNPNQQSTALQKALSDLERVRTHTPDLEDARSLHLWATLLYDFSCGDGEGECVEIPPELLNLGDLIPAEALELLKKPGLLEKVRRPQQNLALNAWALELSLVTGNHAAAKAFLESQEKLCPDCPSTLYLKARWAEQDGLTSEAIALYSKLVTKAVRYRDAAWRYAELAMTVEGPEWEQAVKDLTQASLEFSERDGVALRLFVSVVNESAQDLHLLIRVAKKRFGDKPLPSAVRKAMVRALRSR
jgi:tetratricopeptide (TPR) repeat protein